MQLQEQNLITEFRRHLESLGLSTATIRYYVSDIRVFLRFVHNTQGDFSVTEESFESYEQFLKVGTLPRKTINRKLSSLRNFSAYLVEKDILKKNRMATVRNASARDPYIRSSLFHTLLPIAFFICIVIIGGLLLSSVSRNTDTTFTSAAKGVSIPVWLKADSAQVPYILEVTQGEKINLEATAQQDTGILQRTGRDSVAAGETEKRIAAPVNISDLVFVTPTSAVETNYFVTETNGGFIIRFNAPLKKEFSFNWMVVAEQLPIDTQQ